MFLLKREWLITFSFQFSNNKPLRMKWAVHRIMYGKLNGFKKKPTYHPKCHGYCSLFVRHRHGDQSRATVDLSTIRSVDPEHLPVIIIKLAHLKICYRINSNDCCFFHCRFGNLQAIKVQPNVNRFARCVLALFAFSLANQLYCTENISKMDWGNVEFALKWILLLLYNNM